MSGLRAATLQIGAAGWALNTIGDRGFGVEQGSNLVFRKQAGNGDTRIAPAGKKTDMAVARWLWAATQRAAGRDDVFDCYSTARGGVLAPGDDGGVACRPHPAPRRSGRHARVTRCGPLFLRAW
ncbi:hypothetical protein [uncultured Jannaschia sp.]|uniref:hypothetical protein n=1 Tax=uncultured Jannaschia sp. TaxID=293347 RepID=UPI00263A0B61|nr:hypothetical protein [uncultured Jannaschia sp.]